MKHDLEQQVTQFIAEALNIIALDRIEDLVRFFNRVRRDRLEALLQVPGAAMVRVPELRHNFMQFLD
jgi:hypothetical protein